MSSSESILSWFGFFFLLGYLVKSRVAGAVAPRYHGGVGYHFRGPRHLKNANRYNYMYLSATSRGINLSPEHYSSTKEGRGMLFLIGILAEVWHFYRIVIGIQSNTASIAPTFWYLQKEGPCDIGISTTSLQYPTEHGINHTSLVLYPITKPDKTVSGGMVSYSSKDPTLSEDGHLHMQAFWFSLTIMTIVAVNYKSRYFPIPQFAHIDPED